MRRRLFDQDNKESWYGRLEKNQWEGEMDVRQINFKDKENFTITSNACKYCTYLSNACKACLGNLNHLLWRILNCLCRAAVLLLNYKTALQAATISVTMVSGKNIWQLKFWWKSPIGDLRIKEKVTWKIIRNRSNLINSTSGGITCLFLFPSHRSESQMRKLKMSCGSKWQIWSIRRGFAHHWQCYPVSAAL